MPTRVDTSEHRASIQDQHFWITATTIAINAFLMSQVDQLGLSVAGILWIGLLNLYAVFLILHRSAYHAGKLMLPDSCLNVPQQERGFRHKWAETRLNLPIVARQLFFAIGECSGTLFYLLLVGSSYMAVVVLYTR